MNRLFSSRRSALQSLTGLATAQLLIHPAAVTAQPAGLLYDAGRQY
jgi:hypothetical protein